MAKSEAKEMKPREAGKPAVEIGKRIRLRRVERRISQAELGQKLGVSFQQVNKYEKGVDPVGAARLQQIATALDVPVTFFYDGDGKSREVESLLFLDSALSLRILRAYSQIEDQTVKRQLVSLVDKIALGQVEFSKGVNKQKSIISGGNFRAVPLKVASSAKAPDVAGDEAISKDEFWALVKEAALSQIQADRLDTPEAHTAYIRERINPVLKP
jgi:transcriptional regulator with XRE-family HTH domain